MLRSNIVSSHIWDSPQHGLVIPQLNTQGQIWNSEKANFLPKWRGKQWVGLTMLWLSLNLIIFIALAFLYYLFKVIISPIFIHSSIYSLLFVFIWIITIICLDLTYLWGNKLWLRKLETFTDTILSKIVSEGKGKGVRIIRQRKCFFKK